MAEIQTDEAARRKRRRTLIGWLAVFMLHLYFNEKIESPLENSLRTENKIKR